MTELERWTHPIMDAGQPQLDILAGEILLQFSHRIEADKIRYSSDPATARPPKTAATMTAMVDVVVVITWREVVNKA